MTTDDYPAGVAHHVVLRGHSRGRTFFEPADYQVFLDLFYDAQLKHGLRVHAYALLPNRAHLLVTPSRDDSICFALSEVIRRFERYANRSDAGRTREWAGWYRVNRVDSPEFLLTCYRYIERTPVVDGLGNQPVDWFWSSARANLQGVLDNLVSPHEVYLSLGPGPAARRQVYARLFTKVRDPGTAGESPRKRVLLPSGAGSL